MAIIPVLLSWLGFGLGYLIVRSLSLVRAAGVGLATAVAVDATIVRMVLVPSTMALVGDANWWIPRWLDRVLPRLDLEGTSTQDEPPAKGGT